MATKGKFQASKIIPELKSYLTELEQTQKPGEVTAEEVSKTEVLASVKDEIMKLRAKGYTVKQIASAMNKGDSFGILPKSITQMLNQAGTKKQPTRKRKAKEPEQSGSKPGKLDEAVTHPDRIKVNITNVDEL